MRRIFLATIIFILVIYSCSTTSKKQTKPTVTVSIIPQQFFVNQIAGNFLTVNVMVPPGGSPATYEPTPQQMMNLAASDAYFKIGHIGFEKAWMPKLESVNPNMKIFDTSEGLNLIKETHGHKHGDHYHYGINPHIWTSPNLVKKQAASIFKALLQLYPEQADLMQINLNDFLKKIDTISLELDKTLSEFKGANFIVYHPVWTYLAKDYQLNEIAIEKNGKEATPGQLKEVIDFAKSNNIKVIFIQKEFSDTQAKTIAKEIQGKVVHLNPLAYNWFDIMNEFLYAFKEMKNK